MWCYDEEGNKLGVISCVPKEGEEHMFDYKLYICTGEWLDKGCYSGVKFKKIS